MNELRALEWIKSKVNCDHTDNEVELGCAIYDLAVKFKSDAGNYKEKGYFKDELIGSTHILKSEAAQIGGLCLSFLIKYCHDENIIKTSK